MFRAPDPWADEEEPEPLECGFPRGLEAHYDLEKEIGKGGFGSVRIATSKATGNAAAQVFTNTGRNHAMEMTRHPHGLYICLPQESNGPAKLLQRGSAYPMSR